MTGFFQGSHDWISETVDYNVIVALPYWVLSGVSVFSANLVRGLQAESVSAHILLTEHDTELVNIPDPLIPLPTDVPVKRLAVSRHDSWSAHWIAMVRYLEERAPCIYIPTYDWRHSCVSPKLSNGVAIVGAIRSDDPLHYDHVARLGRFWNAIVAVSSAVEERVAALLPTLARRIVTIPNGVDVPGRLPERGLEEGAPLRVIYHGVLNQHQKRILDLPRIVAALLDQQVPVELTIVGDGPQQEQLLEASRDLVERGAMRVSGLLPHESALELLEEHDVYILTSAFEGMPNALLEAMARGCVPVVTDVRSGIPELIRDGANGFRVRVGDIEAFAQRLALLQRDAKLRRQMSLRAYDTIRKGSYGIEDMAQRYIDLFGRVLDEARRGVYKRPKGRLRPPPQVVAGVSILPGDRERQVRETEFALSWETRLPPPVLAAARLGQRVGRRIRSVLRRGQAG